VIQPDHESVSTMLKVTLAILTFFWALVLSVIWEMYWEDR
jgi:hypothetical protein